MRIFACNFLMVALFLWGCGGNRKKIPLSEENLVYLLVDVHVAEAAIQDLYGVTKDSVGQVYYDQIYQLHHIDNALFDTTMAILRKDPEYASKVYRKVMEIIDKSQAASE